MTTAETVVETAPAKVNLCLHVTGRRADGYHLLDSLVMFAGSEAADRVSVTLGTAGLTVTGPRADGVPLDATNLALRAAEECGVACTIALEKHLPSAGGIGGGTADGAAVLRALARLGAGHLDAVGQLALGADMPVCVLGQTARMRGIGERVDPVRGWPELPAVLVNPGVGVSTPDVFRGLARPDNPPLSDSLPRPGDVRAAVGWLRSQRNDLEASAKAIVPEIDQVLAALAAQPGCGLARMSGSGGTCFGLFETRAQANRAAGSLAVGDWWAVATTLGQN